MLTAFGNSSVYFINRNTTKGKHGRHNNIKFIFDLFQAQAMYPHNYKNNILIFNLFIVSLDFLYQ